MGFFILLGIFFSLENHSCNARAAGLEFHMSLYHKKGIALGPVLVSEIHSIEEIRQGEPLSLRMRGGVEVLLEAHFQDDPYLFGPSEFIEVTGQILDKKGRVLKNFDTPLLLISLGEEKIIVHREETQLIELKMIPMLR